MAFKKGAKGRATQEVNMDSGRSTPAPEEQPEDEMTKLVRSLPSEHQDEVLTIINTPSLPIDTRLTYLEDYLTVGQAKNCRKLLEAQCSNFKKYLPKAQTKFVDQMIQKKDFASLTKMVSGIPEALEAFQNYMMYNGYEENADKKSSKEKGAKSKTNKKGKCNKREVSSEDESEEDDEEEQDDGEEEPVSEESSGEEEEPAKPAPKKKNKDKKGKEDPKKSEPDQDMSYEDWDRLRKNCEENGKSVPSPVGIWEMAAKAERELAELSTKVTSLERDNEKLRKDLQETEEKRKSEKDALNRVHEQKLQDASRHHLEQEQKLKDQHARELAAAYLVAGQNSENHPVDD